ncbi:cytochrome c biogenesis protein CcsA [Cytophagales bacterium LB-30]|uniref:Cytochrome c biogenesis protein CcsA n=1 Tax=Shiella aurantiaca TaxID=3058365 RepID=A0ABT8F2T7_9BACT|nr:cytochrome c biogenesis protein CcsA [Shiella aurantiaca]MDN4164613.1 cytochrome c biogenesis protein CcsA [Shiella aurantiaca]
MINTFPGNAGHLLVIISFVTALAATFSFYKASQENDLAKSWLKTASLVYYLHVAAVIGVVVALFYILLNHLFEYHYAWSYTSINLPFQYILSSFWNGQEGSFLLWIFWNALIGLVLLHTNRTWKAPVMTIYALVQAFLASMILGVVISDVKIGSSPFILLRDALSMPVFQINPNFVPEDGNGLNPLLQNYWMVIHPPTLFLGYASTLIPFAFCVAGLWKKRYREWIRPTLPWALFSAGVLGLGIIMGAYWAYETLNFGGYWNWDPVENAVYVPWIVLVASIHTMIAYNKSNTALKSSIILVIATFIMILYSTFLTRSGILGNSSVHSFTDLGLFAQLVVYMAAFTILSIGLAIVRWKEIPSSEKETSTYSREFWIFMGATVLSLMAFQVIIPTSIPVYNAIIEGFGGVSNLAPPADQIGFYTQWQLWLSILIAILSGTGQFFWWEKMDKEKLKQVLTAPLIITLLLSGLIIALASIREIPYMILLTASMYSLVANSFILYSVAKSNIRLSGGAITHIGVALMLLGVLFSSGYSHIISENNTGLLYSREFDDEVNQKNLLLFVDETREMDGYQLIYKGQRLELRDREGYIAKEVLRATAKHDYFTVSEMVQLEDEILAKGDTVRVFPENTHYEIAFTKNGRTDVLYPRLQLNPQMGNVVSPAIMRGLWRDIYTHVTVVPPTDEEIEWDEPTEQVIKPQERFFLNDQVSILEEVAILNAQEDPSVAGADLAVQAKIRVFGKEKEYLIAPKFIIKDGMIGRVPDVSKPLGLRITVQTINPEENTFTLKIEKTQRDYIILKAVEKPLINLLWLGTLVLLIGFGVALSRRYSDFIKMRDKGIE